MSNYDLEYVKGKNFNGYEDQYFALEGFGMWFSDNRNVTVLSVTYNLTNEDLWDLHVMYEDF